MEQEEGETPPPMFFANFGRQSLINEIEMRNIAKWHTYTILIRRGEFTIDFYLCVSFICQFAVVTIN